MLDIVNEGVPLVCIYLLYSSSLEYAELVCSGNVYNSGIVFITYNQNKWLVVL